jgi:hypothetical protein
MDLLSAIREALRFTRSTRSKLAQGRPFTVPLTLFPSRLRELLRKLKSNLA